MTLFTRGLLFSASILVASQGIAQTTEEPAGTETPAAETAETPAAEDEAPEEQVDVPQAPQIISENFGDWELRCTADKSDCFMYQLMQDDAQNPVAEFTIVALPEGSAAAAGATVVTPLGTMLDTGLIVQVDSGQARKYAYNWCDQSGCFARFGFEPTMLNNYKKGNVARVRLVSVSRPEQPVDLTLSLTGFTGAFNAMSDALKATQ